MKKVVLMFFSATLITVAMMNCSKDNGDEGKGEGTLSINGKSYSVYSDCICGNKQDHIVGQNCGRTILKQDAGRYFIFNSYQNWMQDAREQTASVMGQDYVDNIDKEKEAFEQGWDKFIEQVRKEGKYRK